MLAIIRNLPLREPTVLSARAVRKILQVTDGVTAKVFRLLNDLAIAAIETGVERITDDARGVPRRTVQVARGARGRDGIAGSGTLRAIDRRLSRAVSSTPALRPC